MIDKTTIGFIGLGVMGEPMCRHLVTKSGSPVITFDLEPEPVGRLAEIGATAARSVAEVARAAEIIFVSLPSGKHLQALCEGPAGLSPARGPVRLLSTSVQVLCNCRKISPRRSWPRASHMRMRPSPAPARRPSKERCDYRRRQQAGVRQYRAAASVLRFRSDPLRRRRIGSGRENHEQHGPRRYRNGVVRGRRNSAVDRRSTPSSCSILLPKGRPIVSRCAITA